jgi:hypothetical protein
MNISHASIESDHQHHRRQGRMLPDCPLCWRAYHRHLLTIPRRPMVPYSYETVYALSPGKIVLDEQWHPHIVAAIDKQPGGDYGLQYAVTYEDGKQRVYQLWELLHFACTDRDHLLALFTKTGRQDACADHAAYLRYYEEAERAAAESAHLEHYQQQLLHSTSESDRSYYTAYLEAFQASLQQGEQA